ncbi:hypothetical protein DFH09DRAFT_1324946 [Mycena vulgaris]|nr:hypothetical protein DFH09DRAFT_1324946 [Mycena vulgaris]
MADDKRVKFQWPKKEQRLSLFRSCVADTISRRGCSSTPKRSSTHKCNSTCRRTRTLKSLCPRWCRSHRRKPQAPLFAALMNACLASFSADDTICVRCSVSSSTLSFTLSPSSARLASFSADDTICVRRSASSFTVCPTQPSSPRLLPHAITTSYAHATRPREKSPKTHTYTKPKVKKVCSPVKSLFAFPPSPPTPAPANGVIRVPRPPLAAVDEDGDAWVDEEGWADDDTNADAFRGNTEVEGDTLRDEDAEGEEDGEDGEDEDDEGDDTFDKSALPTPVPHVLVLLLPRGSDQVIPLLPIIGVEFLTRS